MASSVSYVYTDVTNIMLKITEQFIQNIFPNNCKILYKKKKKMILLFFWKFRQIVKNKSKDLISLILA